MAWEWHSPSGVYKDHALSGKIRRAAVADAMFAKFARPEPNYGKKRGESITITRILPLPLATRIGEVDRLPSGRPLIETKAIEVSEWGFKTELTQFEQNLTHFDLTNPFQGTLRDQMRLTMDGMIAEAFKSTPYKYIPQAAGGSFDTDGTASTQADVNLSIDDLRNIRDELQGTLKCPKFRNGKYIGILSTRAARGIKNDSEYKDWLAPTTSGPLSDSRLRDVEEIMLFETNHFDALDNDIGSGDVLGEAVFFGADAVALAIVEDPELRRGLPEDLGRFVQFGWVGTMEADVVWENADYARCIHVTSDDS